jgi:hypothetical protein
MIGRFAKASFPTVRLECGGKCRSNAKDQRILEKNMQDEHFSLALSLLGHCYRAREQLVDAVRAAARSRIEAR